MKKMKVSDEEPTVEETAADILRRMQASLSEEDQQAEASTLVDRHYELKQKLEEWEAKDDSLPSEAMIKETQIAKLKKQFADVDQQLQRARGDFLDAHAKKGRVDLAVAVKNLVDTTGSALQWPDIFSHTDIKPLCDGERIRTPQALRMAVKAAGIVIPARPKGRGNKKLAQAQKVEKL